MIESLELEERFARRTLNASFAAALLVFVAVLTWWAEHSLRLHANEPRAAMLEAELREVPPMPAPPPPPRPIVKVEKAPPKSEPAHLHEAEPAAKPAVPEQKISTDLNAKGKASALKASDLDQANQTTRGTNAPVQPATHGPSVLDSPAPKLPSYLREQNLQTHVLIEFDIQADGASTPHLVGSSGNEEIDALALKTAKQWRFTPAANNGVAINSRIRLRINFQVDDQ